MSALTDRPEDPGVGTCWRHWKGGCYLVVANATMEADQERVVVYRELGGDQTWVRPLAQWHEVVSDGRPRFVPMAP